MTPSVTASPSLTPWLSATATPTVTDAGRLPLGHGKALQVLAWPQPRPVKVAVQVDGACDAVRLGIYSVGWKKVADLDGAGLAAAGWAQVELPGGLASGAYYLVGQAQQGGRAMGPPARGKMFVLR